MYKFVVSVIYLVTLFEVVHPKRYPAAFGKLSHSEPVYKMPAACNGMKYCLSNENYPIDVVKKLIGNITTLTVEKSNEDSDGMFMQRDSTCCGGEEQTIYYIVDNNSQVRVVVQVDKILKQKYTIKTCNSKNNQATKISKTTAKRYNLRCYDIEMKYDFLVISTDFSKLEQISVQIPVCCACRYDTNII